MPYTYEYPRPAVTVDVAVFGTKDGERVVLLIERKHDPFQGQWAMPGGFVDKDEALEHAALRELSEETGLTGVSLTQLGAYGAPGRDPRAHTVSVVYVTEVDVDKANAVAGDDAANVKWHRWVDLAVGGNGGGVPLAFDHCRILEDAKKKLDGG